MLPVYLGIGPAEYYSPGTSLPAGFRWAGPMSVAVHRWLIRAGVTHILAFEPHPDWPVRLLWQGVDPFVHAVLARSWLQPLFLYELDGAVGRVYLTRSLPARAVGAPRANATEEGGGPDRTIGTAEISELRGNLVRIEVQAAEPCFVVLTDLMYPGWEVEVDGRPGKPIRWSGMYRAVRVGRGRHIVQWRYRPASLLVGALASALGLLAVGLLAVLDKLQRRWHRISSV